MYNTVETSKPNVESSVSVSKYSGKYSEEYV